MIWKTVFDEFPSFKVLSWNLPGKAKENHEDISQRSRCLGSYLKLALAECNFQANFLV
jgi:hypothetical protein